MLYNGAMVNALRGPESRLLWPIELWNALYSYRKSCMAVNLDRSDLTLRLKVKVKHRKRPITCLISPVELRNVLITNRKSYVAIDCDLLDLTLRLKVKVKRTKWPITC